MGLAYHVSGAAIRDTLAACHAVAESAASLADFAERWRMVLVDVLVHGNSWRFTESELEDPMAGAVQALAELCEKEYLHGRRRPVVLYGHSMDGALASLVVLHRSWLVAGLVLDAPAWFTAGQAESLERREEVRRDPSRLLAGKIEVRETAVAEPERIVVPIHPGGYVAGAARYDDARNGELALRLKAKVICPEYRLAPEHPFLDGLVDCVAATRHAAKETKKAGVPSSSTETRPVPGLPTPRPARSGRLSRRTGTTASTRSSCSNPASSRERNAVLRLPRGRAGVDVEGLAHGLAPLSRQSSGGGPRAGSLVLGRARRAAHAGRNLPCRSGPARGVELAKAFVVLGACQALVQPIAVPARPLPQASRFPDSALSASTRGRGLPQGCGAFVAAVEPPSSTRCGTPVNGPARSHGQGRIGDRP